MEGNNNAPFRVGQKVVRVGKTARCLGEIGDIRTVLEITQCRKCKDWYIDIGDRDKETADIFISVCDCGRQERIKEPIIFYYSSLFAPVEPAYENISSELAQEAMKQRTETDVPVKEVAVN